MTSSLNASLPGRDFILYGGMGYTEPEHRAKKLAMNLLKVSNDWVRQNNGILGFMVSEFLSF